MFKKDEKPFENTALLSAHSQTLDKYSNAFKSWSDIGSLTPHRIKTFFKTSVSIALTRDSWDFNKHCQVKHPEIYSLIALNQYLSEGKHDEEYIIETMADAFNHLSFYMSNHVTKGIGIFEALTRTEFIKRVTMEYIRSIKLTGIKCDVQESRMRYLIGRAFQRCVQDMIPYVSYYICIFQLCFENNPRIHSSFGVHHRPSPDSENDIIHVEIFFERLNIDNPLIGTIFTKEYMDMEIQTILLLMKQRDDFLRMDDANLVDYKKEMVVDPSPQLFGHLLLMYGYDLKYDVTEIFSQEVIDTFFKGLRNRSHSHMLFTKLYYVVRYLDAKGRDTINIDIIKKHFNYLKLIHKV